MRVVDFVFRNRILSLIAGYFLCSISGIGYVFGIYSPFVKATFGYDQTQIEFISTMAAFCMYFSPLTGIFYDFFGPRATAFMGGVLSFSGYFLCYLALHHLFFTNYIILGVFFMMGGIGTGALYTAALGPNQENFHQRHRGKITGSLVALYGLSAAIVTEIYTLFLRPNIPKLILFLGVAPAAISILGVLFLSKVEEKKEKVDNEETPLTPEPQDNPEVVKLMESLPEVQPLRLLLNVNFYIMVPTFLIITGLGLMVIANVGSLVLSLGEPNGAQDKFVMMLSLFNCLGRLTVGISSDLLSRWISRPLFLTVALVLMGAAQFTLSFGSIPLLYVGISLTGFAYGNTWGLIPVLAREFFGKKYWGTNFAILGLGSALGSYLFSTLMAGRIYQAHTKAGETDCFGVDCFRWSFLIGTICCAVGVVLSLLLWFSGRGLYKIIREINEKSLRKTEEKNIQ